MRYFRIWNTLSILFDSAHRLENYQGKCENLHGHTYKLHVIIRGEVGPDGMVMDLILLSRIVKEKIAEKNFKVNL